MYECKHLTMLPFFFKIYSFLLYTFLFSLLFCVNVDMNMKYGWTDMDE